MGVCVVVSPGDTHLSLAELSPVIDEIEGPVEVRWSGSREDIRLWEAQAHREFVLFVEDQEHAERAMWATGTPLPLTEEDLRAAKKALAAPLGNAWRSQVDELGSLRGTLLLTSVLGSSIRQGKSPEASISIAHNCLFQRVHPADADVLLRIRAKT